MGNCVGGFKRRTRRIAPWRKSRTIVLCFLGIDGAGKTTVVKALQGEDLANVHPTIGFSRAEFSLKKHKIVAYDLGGGERIRDIWPTYYAEVYGIVYVVDASAGSRFAENQRIVESLVECHELMSKPCLFLLNKKDLPEAIDEIEFSDRFDLHEMAKRNTTDIRVEGTCAIKGTGKEIDAVIIEGLEWLVDKILENYANIEKGVEVALKELKERQIQDRIERQHRMIGATSPNDTPTTEDGSVDLHPVAITATIEPTPPQLNGHVGLSAEEILESEREVEDSQPPPLVDNAAEEQRPVTAASTANGSIHSQPQPRRQSVMVEIQARRPTPLKATAADRASLKSADKMEMTMVQPAKPSPLNRVINEAEESESL